MPDDELVSFWNDVHPPLPKLPQPLGWDDDDEEDLFGAPEPKPVPPPHPPFCLRCGLPLRICGGSDHSRPDVGDPLRHLEEEKRLFGRKARFLSDDEKRELRERLTMVRQEPAESQEEFFARSRALTREGKIVLPWWRLEQFREVIRER